MSDDLKLLLLGATLGGTGFGFLYLRDYLRRTDSRFWSVIAGDLLTVITIGVLIILACIFSGFAYILPFAMLYLLLFRLEPKESEQSLARAGILRELAVATRHGLALDTFLDALAADYSIYTARRLKFAAERLREGARLSVALQDAKLLPEHGVAALAAAEIGGGQPIPGALRRVADDLRTQSALRASYMFWFYYSIVMLFICGVIALFELVFVVPKIHAALSATKVASTGINVLMALSKAVTWAGIPACFVAILVRMLLTNADIARAAGRGARFIESLLPLSGARLHHRALARSARVLQTLSELRVPLPQMCRSVATAALSGPYAGTFARIAGETESGQPLAHVLDGSTLPVAFAWHVRAGLAGDFPAAMQAAAEYHDAQAERYERLIATLLPCLVIGVGGLTVGMFYAIILLNLYQLHKIVR